MNVPAPVKRLAALLLFVPAVSAQVKISERVLPPLPDALGVAGAFAGVSGDALLVAGGANFPGQPPWEGGTKKWHDEIYVLPRGATNWLTGFRLPRPLAYGVSVPFDGGVLCLGGNDATSHHEEVFLLRWREGRVLVETNFPALPVRLANACGVICAGHVYIAGGEARPKATSALAGFWRLNLMETNALWQRLPDCPGPARTLALAASDGGTVYILGGVALSADAENQPVRRYLADVQAFDVRKQTWTQRADLPQPRAAVPGPAPYVGGGWFALLGGDDGSHVGFQPIAQHPGFSDQILLWHPERKRFQFGGNLRTPRVTTPAVMWEHEAVLPSGEIRPGVRSPVVSSLRFATP